MFRKPTKRSQRVAFTPNQAAHVLAHNWQRAFTTDAEHSPPGASARYDPGASTWEPPRSVSPPHHSSETFVGSRGVGGESEVDLPSLHSRIGYKVNTSGDSEDCGNMNKDEFERGHRTVCYTDEATEPTVPGYAGSVSRGREVSGVTSMPAGGNGSIATNGAGMPPMMKGQPIRAYAHDGHRYGFEPMVRSDGNTDIMKIDRTDPNVMPHHVDTVDGEVWVDYDSMNYRVWPKKRDKMNKGNTFDHAIRRQEAQARAFRAVNDAKTHAAMNPQRRIGSGTPSIAELNARNKARWKDKGGS